MITSSSNPACRLGDRVVFYLATWLRAPETAFPARIAGRSSAHAGSRGRFVPTDAPQRSCQPQSSESSSAFRRPPTPMRDSGVAAGLEERSASSGHENARGAKVSKLQPTRVSNAKRADQ